MVSSRGGRLSQSSSTRAARVTVADVARYAGVSSAVVSYVINGGPRPVAAATAERVREAVSVLGYRPNSSARSLRTGRTGIVGLVLPGTSNPFFGEYADVIYDSAAGAGLAVLTANSAGSVRTEFRLVEELARRGVDGIIVATLMAPSDVADLRNPGLPMVLLNCPFAIPGHRTIGPRAAEGARQIVDHLLTVHAHRTVAYITGEAEGPDPEARETGWREALRSHGAMDAQLARAPFTRSGGYAAARQLLETPTPPSAVFVSSDAQTQGVLFAFNEAGLRVPEDIAVVSFDGTEDSGFTWPPLTVARQPERVMAAAAISSLTTDGSLGHELFDMEIVIRSSCGCHVNHA